MKGEGSDRGSSLESPPHLPASLLPLQHADQIYFKPHGPCLVGLPVSRDDVRVLHDADSDLTPVFPPHLYNGVEASYGHHGCRLWEGQLEQGMEAGEAGLGELWRGSWARSTCRLWLSPIQSNASSPWEKWSTSYQWMPSASWTLSSFSTCCGQHLCRSSWQSTSSGR